MEDPEREKPLTPTTLSPQPLATATPSLVVFDTILGILISLFLQHLKLIII